MQEFLNAEKNSERISQAVTMPLHRGSEAGVTLVGVMKTTSDDSLLHVWEACFSSRRGRHSCEIKSANLQKSGLDGHCPHLYGGCLREHFKEQS